MPAAPAQSPRRPFARRLPLIHVSTDYVFSGGHPLPYREDDAPEPRTAYGRSKLAGEAAIAATNPDHAILRTAWLYSPHGSNFVKTMLHLAGTRDTIDVVDDQLGNPTYAPDLAEAILVVAERMLDTPDDPRLRGVFHVAGPDSATWCDFAREIMHALLGARRSRRADHADRHARLSDGGRTAAQQPSRFQQGPRCLRHRVAAPGRSPCRSACASCCGA